MNRLALIVFYSALSVIVACNAISAERLNQTPTVRPELDSLGRDIVKAKCQNPKHIATKRVQNRIEPTITDEIQTISCPKAKMEIYKAYYFSPPNELPLNLVISKPHPKMLKQLSVGASLDSIRSKLGLPLWADNHNLVYQLNEEGPSENTITFKFVRGKVSSITWDWSGETY